MEKRKKVVIGMSGGVDSSVAAYLLKEQGYDVIGVTMQIWQEDKDYTEREGGCCSLSAVDDARRVANKIGIPFYVMNFRDSFKEKVIDYFVQEYIDGKTPNPCIACNKHLKFDELLRKAQGIGADYVATGHYAKIIDGKLHKATDKNKDQSYFLAYVNRDIFKEVLFPLQDIEKPEVRKIAEKYDLITAKKKDSTGICFIGERNFTNFLKNYLPNQEGDIVNIETNEVLGKHIGLMYYTIGQRKGLNLGDIHDKIHSKAFVVKKDLTNNILYIATGDENNYLYSNRAIIKDFNFLVDTLPSTCTCKFRYRQQDIPCQIKVLENNIIEVNYDHAKAVTPGQFCVLYQDDLCLGGGIIDEVFK